MFLSYFCGARKSDSEMTARQGVRREIVDDSAGEWTRDDGGLCGNVRKTSVQVLSNERQYCAFSFIVCDMWKAPERCHFLNQSMH